MLKSQVKRIFIPRDHRCIIFITLLIYSGEGSEITHAGVQTLLSEQAKIKAEVLIEQARLQTLLSEQAEIKAELMLEQTLVKKLLLAQHLAKSLMQLQNICLSSGVDLRI